MKVNRSNFSALGFSIRRFLSILICMPIVVAATEVNLQSSSHPEIFCEDQYKNQVQTTFREQANMFRQSMIKDIEEGFIPNDTPADLYDIFKSLSAKMSKETDGSQMTMGPVIENTKIPLLEKAPGRLKYRVNKLMHSNSSIEYSTTNESISLIFEDLSLDQFNYLKQTFGQGHSSIQFDPSIQYRLQDFLSPALSAISDWHVYGQCTLFASMYLDATNNRTRYSSGWAHHDAIVERLQDSSHFRRIKKGEKLLPGDVLVLSTYEKKGSTLATEREYVIGHIYFYLDENLSIGSNPSGLRLGTYSGYDYFKSGIFSGDEKEYSLEHPQSSGDLGILVYRRIQWTPAPLNFRNYKNGAPALALPIARDKIGRYSIDRNNILFCGSRD